MTYPQLPEAEEVASHFVTALANPEILEEPYRRGQITNVLPESVCTGLLTLPIAPPVITIDTGGEPATLSTISALSSRPRCGSCFPRCRC